MDSFVASPDGSRYPRTPSFIEAVDTLHKLDSLLSIEKLSPKRSRLPATEMSTKDLSTTRTATSNASDNATPPATNLRATDKLQEDIQNEFRTRLEETRETEHQLIYSRSSARNTNRTQCSFFLFFLCGFSP